MSRPSPRDRLIESGDACCSAATASTRSGVDAIIDARRHRQDHALQAVRLQGRAGRSRAGARGRDAGAPGSSPRSTGPAAVAARAAGADRPGAEDAGSAADDFYGCPFINAVGESDKADDRMRSLAIAHKTIVLDRLTALCAEAGIAEPDAGRAYARAGDRRRHRDGAGDARRRRRRCRRPRLCGDPAARLAQRPNVLGSAAPVRAQNSWPRRASDGCRHTPPACRCRRAPRAGSRRHRRMSASATRRRRLRPRTTPAAAHCRPRALNSRWLLPSRIGILCSG